MSAITGNRLMNPIHPHAFTKLEVSALLKLTATATAQALGVVRAAVSTMLHERASLWPEMALCAEKSFGISTDALMRVQNSFEIPLVLKYEEEMKVARFTVVSELLMSYEPNFT
jgi:addiction module HigA family antidote